MTRLRNPPPSFIPTTDWQELPLDQQPRDHVPIVFGRLEIDQTVIG